MRIYTVTGESMLPAVGPGERLLVSTTMGARHPARGDIVVLRAAAGPSSHSIKRVVGLPGEDVRLSDGILFIGGEYHAEPYLQGLPATVGLGDQSWSLSHDQYFLMGDNRAHSTDSRHQGPFRSALIVGKAWLRCWPLGRWGAVV